MNPTLKTLSFALFCVFFTNFQQSGQLRAQSVDDVLRGLLQRHGVESLDAGPVHSAAEIELGQALFFDQELSGNRDTSCATCHHPTLATGDGLALPVGTAPENPGALGLERMKGSDREFVPRNAPEVFNRGSVAWTSMFWDSRVAENEDGTIDSPAGVLEDLDSVLAVQAMFPVTSRDEMRGLAGDEVAQGTRKGEPNELALIPDEDLDEIWNALMDRLLLIPGYQTLFAAAFPGTAPEDLTFANAATAIAAFESDAFTFLDSPFDRYLAGEDSALSPHQKRGALLFFGRANCANCHSGPLLTDQRHWAIAAPQLGPGKTPHGPYDAGRYLINGKYSDLFAFRTPPLRNVAVTAPYMHDGAFKDLKSVIRHHSNPLFSLLTYRPRRNLEQEELRDTVLDDWRSFVLLSSTLDWRQLSPRTLNKRNIRDLEQFLQSLTAPDLDAKLRKTIPATVPSGLPVEGN